MNDLKMQTLRARVAVDECQKQFDSAVDFCLRMADELRDARARRMDMTCPAANLSNAANEVRCIAARLDVLLDAHSALKSIGG